MVTYFWISTPYLPSKESLIICLHMYPPNHCDKPKTPVYNTSSKIWFSLKNLPNHPITNIKRVLMCSLGWGLHINCLFGEKICILIFHKDNRDSCFCTVVLATLSDLGLMVFPQFHVAVNYWTHLFIIYGLFKSCDNLFVTQLFNLCRVTLHWTWDRPKSTTVHDTFHCDTKSCHFGMMCKV